jgi:hypothetical protein
MALSFKNLVSSVLGSGAKDDKPPSASELFVKTDPKVDGDECLHDLCGKVFLKHTNSSMLNLVE